MNMNDRCRNKLTHNNRWFLLQKMSSSVSEMVNGAALHGDDGHADMELLRVHSKDLHDHMLQDVADCLQSRAFADMVIRCNDGGDREEEIWVHKVVLGAVSPYLRMVSVHS